MFREACVLALIGGCFSKPGFGGGSIDASTGDGGIDDAVDAALIDAPPPDPTVNFAFVTPAGIVGEMTGPGSADTICGVAATAAGLTGTFRAWMSSAGPGGIPDAISRLNGARGWQRTDGRPFLDQITDTKAYYPLTLDAMGTKVNVDDFALYVATATSATNAPSENCEGFSGTSGGGRVMQYGRADADYPSWKDESDTQCTRAVHVYCLQIDHMKAPDLTAPSAKVAFVSTPTILATGPMMLDAKCQTDANTAGIPGTFRALVSEGTNPPRDRIAGSGPWMRRDGVIVSEDLMSFTAPLDIDAAGTYVNAPVSVGANGPASAPGNNCDGWTPGSATPVTQGASIRSNLRAFTSGPQQTCGSMHRVYCFESTN